MPPRLLVLAALIPLLAACGGKNTGKVASASKPPPTSPAKPVRTAVRTPVAAKPALVRPQVVPGLEGVIGASEAELTRQFGTARLEVWEGDARKLQYSGTPCVLDIYLYPAAQGREPLASHVEARRSSDGEEVDRIACVAALRRR
jgi:hypothetical protein